MQADMWDEKSGRKALETNLGFITQQFGQHPRDSSTLPSSHNFAIRQERAFLQLLKYKKFQESSQICLPGFHVQPLEKLV